jgi:hypothetical protein
VWHYNEIWESSTPTQGAVESADKPILEKNVDMKFVDTCSCGNYQLQASPK